MILPNKVPMAIFVCPPSNSLQKMVIIMQAKAYQVGGRKGRREKGEKGERGERRKRKRKEWEEGREGGKEGAMVKP